MKIKQENTKRNIQTGALVGQFVLLTFSFNLFSNILVLCFMSQDLTRE